MELALEVIGDDTIQMLRSWERVERSIPGMARYKQPSMTPWVAEIVGIQANGRPALRWLRGRKDYSNANSVGSRGVMLWFELLEGGVYWINDHQTWKSWKRYYATVHNAELHEISEEDAIAWANDCSDSANDPSTLMS